MSTPRNNLREAARSVVEAHARAFSPATALRRDRLAYLAECVAGLHKELAIAADRDDLVAEIVQARRAGDHPLRMAAYRERFWTLVGELVAAPDTAAKLEAVAKINTHLFGAK